MWGVLQVAYWAYVRDDGWENRSVGMRVVLSVIAMESSMGTQMVALLDYQKGYKTDETPAVTTDDRTVVMMDEDLADLRAVMMDAKLVV